MQAVSQDPDTARLMGINVDRIIMVAFAVGATLAAVAGVAQGLQVTNINFKMGFLAGLEGIHRGRPRRHRKRVGRRRRWFTLGIVEAMAVQFIPGTFGGSPWKDVWAFALLIIVPSSGPRASSVQRWWTGHELTNGEPRSSPRCAPHGGHRRWCAADPRGLLLSWSYDDRILDDISVRFFPIGIQIYAMGLGLAVALRCSCGARRGWTRAAACASGIASIACPRHAHRDREAGRRRRERQ